VPERKHRLGTIWDFGLQILDMLMVIRSDMDRRSGEDRRRAYDLDYFSNGGVERRHWKEQRSNVERRIDWTRVSKWSSVSLKALKA
jgi:hypothetical protein